MTRTRWKVAASSLLAVMLLASVADRAEAQPKKKGIGKTVESSEITDLIHQVMVEDIGLCESVQRGMSSGTFANGRLMLRYEHSIKHFQSLVSSALASS